jgi:hypothetical protein
MKKKPDDNLDKNRQKQTSFFLYDKKQKLSWIFQNFLGYATGFPLTMLNDQTFKLVKFFDLNFFELEERKYNEITEGQRSQYIIYMFLGLIPGFLVLFFGLWPYQLGAYKFLNFFFSGNIYNSFFSLLLNIFSVSIIALVIHILPPFFFIIYSRLYFRIVEYLMPETLCIIQIINLNLELTRDDVIYRRDVKSMVLFRMDYLARVTMLIPLHYGIGKPSNEKWIQQHFQNISYYIRERRRWLIAPNETTLDDLRRDFRKLAYYYLTGKYGAWEWQSFELPTEVSKQTRFQKIQGNLIRFIVVTVPLLIMAFYILFPSKFPNPNAKILENLPVIFIAWFFVSLV